MAQCEVLTTTVLIPKRPSQSRPALLTVNGHPRSVGLQAAETCSQTSSIVAMSPAGMNPGRPFPATRNRDRERSDPRMSSGALGQVDGVELPLVTRPLPVAGSVMVVEIV